MVNTEERLAAKRNNVTIGKIPTFMFSTLILGLSLLFFLLASYAVFFSAFLPPTGYYVGR